MAKKYDLEAIVTDISTFLLANLATKLTAITSEKGDSLTLLVPRPTDYFIQTMNTREVMGDPYIHIAAVDAVPVPARSAIANIYIINVMLVLSDAGTDPKIMNRMFRYLRALQELITENFAGLRPDVRMDIESLVPVPLTEVGSERCYKATGVQMKIGIA